MTITGRRPSPGREARRELELVRRLVAGTVVATLAALPFLVLLFLVRAGYAPLADLDGRVAESFNGWARERPTAVALLELVDRVTAPWTFRVLVLVAATVLWRHGRRRLATWAIVTMAVGGILGVVLKVLVDRARPAFDQPVRVVSDAHPHASPPACTRFWARNLTTFDRNGFPPRLPSPAPSRLHSHFP